MTHLFFEGLKSSRVVRCLRYAGFALGAALVAFAAGCGTETADPGDGDRTSRARQPLEFSGMELGEGFNGNWQDSTGNIDEKDGEPTGNVCIRRDRDDPNSRDLLDDQASGSFYLYKDHGIDRELRENLEGRFDLTDSEHNTLEDHFRNNYDISTGTDTVLAILTRWQTIRRKPRPEAGEGEITEGDSICESSSTEPSSFEEFNEKCGTGYLHDRRKGGYILLSVSMSGKSRALKNAVDDAVEAGGGTANDVSVDTMMERLVNQGIDLAFNIDTTVELWKPKYYDQWTGSPVVDSNGRMHPDDWFDYVEWIRSYDSTADDDRDGFVHEFNNNPWDPTHPRYGTKILQKLSRYTEDDFNRCGQSAYEEYLCYADFAFRTRWVKDDEAPTRNLVQRAEWKLNHPSRVRWPAPVADTKNAYESAVQYFNRCMKETDSQITTIHEQTEQCESEFDAGNYGNLCDACEISASHDCSPQTIRDKFRKLPPAPVLPTSGEGTPAPGYPNYEAPIRETREGSTSAPIGNTDLGTHLCALTRAAGEFKGGGEKLRLWTTSSEWKFATATQQYWIRGGVSCAKKSIFFDTANSNWMTERDDSVEISSSGGKEKFLHPEPYASALAGVSGKLNGGGEYGKVKPRKGQKEKLRVESQVGYFKAWATSFGLDSPNGGVPNGYTDAVTTAKTKNGNGGEQVAQLIPAEEGLCFLTKVSGDFDGGAENASVFRRDEHWYVKAEAGCEQQDTCDGVYACAGLPSCAIYKYVEAKATCYPFDQQN